ncbi:MAG: cation:dicarboxylase symporter family transporter [Clostridium sp.]|nr:cation:dicarboxylase symporter family transporter [Clostridium sp.]
MQNIKLTKFILISLILGIFTGIAFPAFAVKLSPLAMMFLNMVKMIIAPLLFATLVIGIAGHGDIKSLGKIGFKTIIYFEIVTIAALAIGLGIGHFTQPGAGLENVINVSAANLDAVNAMSQTGSHASLMQLVMDIFPSSVVKSMAEGNLLQIVVFSLFFALAICAVGQKAKPIMDFLNSLSEVMFKFTEYVMWFAPVGVFAAIASTIGSSGIGILKNYVKIVFSLYFALVVFIIFIILMVCYIVKVPFKGLIRTLKDPALLAFSTASSEAALPKAMEQMEKFGVPKNIVGFVMPTGYTFNLDGSTLYLSMAVLFATQLVGIDLSLKHQLIIMFALMFTSKGVAGVPRASLVVLAGTLSSLGYPLIGVAILLGIDQVLDMGRTTVNLVGNCIATIFIAKWENEFDYEKMNNYLGSNDI